MLIATVLFLAISTTLATVLTSSVSSHRLSREKTVAEQIAADQIESIRRLPYDSLGVVGGNPPGTIPATETVTVRGLTATVTTQVSYVNDPTPTSYATAANYKRVTVTVVRARDSQQLARQVTYVAPPTRAAYGVINQAIINVQIVDLGNNTPVPGVTVSLGTGPSAPRSDTTDEAGSVTFAALTPNPTSGPGDYYDLAVSAPSGYELLGDDVSPGSAAHVQLAPGQTFDTALRVYRPATIGVILHDADGTTFAGAATVTVSSSRGSESFGNNGSQHSVT
jgi:hypothetical protein